jgi:protein-tyrosine phosphatase
MESSKINRGKPFAGLWNFRDMGGCMAQSRHTLKSGLLFRSDELSQLTVADIEQLRNLNLKTLCDLRTPEERDPKPDRLPHGSGIRIVHVPIYHQIPGFLRTDFMQCLGQEAKEKAFVDNMSLFYIRMALECTAELGRVLNLATDERNFPLLIHCTGGKDRTGFVSAILQLLAGVSREEVMADFLVSNQVIAPRMQEVMASVSEVSQERLKPMMDVFPAYMVGALEAILEKYGSFERYYCDACGGSGKKLRMLRKNVSEE